MEGDEKWARQLQSINQSINLTSLNFHTPGKPFLAAVLGVLACFLIMNLQVATAQGVPESYPDEPDDCTAWETVEGCVHDSKGEWECSPYTLCGNEHAAGTATLEGGMGIESTSYCMSIIGSQAADTIYIGSVWIWHPLWQVWYSMGDLGYCNNGQLVWCSGAANPIVVKPYDSPGSSDRVQVPTGSTLYKCGSYRIGKWEVLKEWSRPIGLKVYGCGDKDFIYGTPNSDTLIGGSGQDVVYGRGGDDFICGGYGSFIDHDCSFCDSGSNCTPSGGNDTGNDGGDILFGEEENDVMCGVDDEDYMWGGEGHDHMYGMNDCDYIDGGGGDDRLYAATGESTDLEDFCTDRNQLRGGDGADRLFGSNSKDDIWGEVSFNYDFTEYDGDDHVYGYGGNDRICPGGALYGHEVVEGGDGDDLIIYYMSDYGNDCAPPPYGSWSCVWDPDGGPTADGGYGNDEIHFNASWYLEPCPQVCGGGIILYGNFGYDDCCYCGVWGAGYCDIYACERQDCTDWDPTFNCPFPYPL